MTREAPGDGGRDHGMSLVECLMATTIALALAGGFCHSWLTYQSEYRAQMEHVARDEEARFALAFLVEELRLAAWGDQGRDCPASGVQVSASELSFVANVYDRTSRLSGPALAGDDGVTMSAQAFEPNDTVRIVDVGDETDPSDDVAECRTVIAVTGNRAMLDRALTRTYNVGAPVLSLNRMSYVFDERRRWLMRAQDGSSQRVADNVDSLALAWSDRTLTITIGMHPPRATSKPIQVERRIVFPDAP